MAYTRVLILVGLVVGALAAPPQISGQLPKCAVECVTAVPEKEFTPQTFIYNYEGTSELLSQEIRESEAELKLSAEIHLTRVTPCDGMIEIKKPKIRGQDDVVETELLTERPMMFAMSNHVVTQICAHPEDEPISLNFKKGILSSIQNTLPRISPSFSGKTMREADIMGLCPTTYYVKQEGSSINVEKFKDHHMCTETENANLMSLAYLGKNPFIMGTSNSTCYQKFEKQPLPSGIVTEQLSSVECINENAVNMTKGVFSAIQKSKLSLKGKESPQLPPFPHSYRYSNLTFEEIPPPKRQEYVPIVEEQLKELCSLTEGLMEERAPRVFSKLIEFMARLPEESVEKIHQNIKSGQYCQKAKQMESLYLDAISQIDNGGAVKVIVKEITSKRASIPRTILYSLSLHMMKRPCIHSIQNLKPLFDMEEVPMPILLGAGTMVRRYCSRQPHCEMERPIEEIIEVIEKRISSQYTSSEPKVIRRNLLLLKTIGNMGIMNRKLEKTLLHCIESQSAPSNVRVAAAHAFRQTSCMRQPTEKLIKAATGKTVQDQEVRIISYLSAIRCANVSQSREIFEEIVRDPTTQVRSFVLSHMRSLQVTEAPWLQSQRYNLSTLAIPNDYKFDMRLHSKNIDLSYYLPTMGIGAGIDTDVIFKDSYIPRMIKSNVTLNLMHNVINVGEFGIRLEELEGFVRILLGPEGYLRGIGYDKLIQVIANVIAEVIQKIIHHFKQDGETTTIDVSTLSKILEGINMPENMKPKMDAFARIFGQEIIFSSIQGKPEEINHMIEKVFKVISMIVMQAANTEFDVMSGMQYGTYKFMPTIQGIPIQMKMITTLMAKSKGKISLEQPELMMNNHLGLAAHVNTFFGFSFGAKIGVRMNYTAHSNVKFNIKSSSKGSDYSFKVDIPETGNAGHMKGGMYIFTKLPGKSDHMILPRSQDSKVSQVDGCIPSLDSVGMEACYKIKVPDFISSPYAIPLGVSKMSIMVKKPNPSMPLVSMKGTIKNEQEVKSLKLDVKTSGKGSPIIEEIFLEKMRRGSSKSVLVYVKGPSNSRSVKVEMMPTPSQQGRGYEVRAYSSRQMEVSTSDMVMEMKIAGGHSQRSVKGLFELRTMNHLQPWIKSNIELEGELAMMESRRFPPISMKINKCEVMVRLAEKYETENYIREQPSSDGVQYKFASITKRPAGVLLSVSGDLISKGSFMQMNKHSTVNVQVQTPHYSMESRALVSYLPSRKEVSLLMEKNKEQVLHMQMLLDRKSQGTYDALAKVEIPRRSIKYQLEGKVTEQQQEKYNIHMKALKRQEPVMEISGDVMLRNEETFKQESNLMLKCIRTGNQYLIKSKLMRSPEKHYIYASIDKSPSSKSKMFEIEVEKSMEKLHTQMSVHVPQLIELQSQLDASVPMTHMTIRKNIMLFPNTEKARRIKLYSLFNMERRMIENRLLWDADRDKSKKFETTMHYMMEPSEAKLQLEGEVIVKQDTYKCHADMNLAPLMRRQESPLSMSLSIVTPSQRKFQLRTSLTKKLSSQEKVIDYMVEVETPAGHRYYVDLKNNYEFTPIICKLKSNVMVKSPYVSSSMDIDFERERDQVRLHGKVNANGRMIEQPLSTQLEYTSSPSECHGSTKVLLGQNMICEGRLEKRPQEMKAVFRLSPIHSDKYVLKVEKTPSKIIDIELERNGEKYLECKCHCNPENWSVYLTMPSRSIEAHSQVSRRKLSMELYTQRRERSNYHQNEVRRQENRVMIANMDLSEVTSHGTIVIDVLQDPSKKIEAKVKIQRLAKKNYRALIELKHMSSQANVIAESSFTNRTQKLFIEVYPSQSSSPQVTLLLSHLKTSPISGSIYTMVKTPSRKIEFSGEHRQQEMRRCIGSSMNGTIISDHHGSYDIAATVCAPAYIEIGARKSSKDSMPFVKMGMQNPASLRLEVCEVFDKPSSAYSKGIPLAKLQTTYSLYGSGSWRLKKNILWIGAEVRSPWLISLDTEMELPQLRRLSERIRPLKQNLKKVYNDVMLEAPRDVLADILPESLRRSPEIQQIKEKTIRTLEEIRESILDGGLIERLERIVHIIEEKYEEIIESLKVFEEKLDNALQKIMGVSLKEIKEKMMRMEHILREKVMIIEEEILRILESPRMIREYKFVRWIIELLEDNSIFERIREIIHELKEKFSEEFEAIHRMMQHVVQFVRKEMQVVWHKLEDFAPISRIIHWIEKWLHPSSESPMVLHKAVWTKITPMAINNQEIKLSLKVPLRRPVSSLPAALMSIGLPMHMIKLQHSSRGYVLPMVYPYHKTAKVTENQVVTFDGLVMPFVKSRCQILLSESQGVKILLTKSSPRSSKLLLISPQGQKVAVEIEQGQKVRVPLMDPRQVYEKESLKIQRTSPREVTIETKPFHVIVKDEVILVEAKPSSYNQVRGLLGSHDSEVATDYPRGSPVKYQPHHPEGIHHLDYASAKKVFQQYKEDSSCSIPSY